MNFIFKMVAEALRKIAAITGLSYVEINIIVYYILVPLSWAVMIDIAAKNRNYYVSAGYIVFCVLVILRFGWRAAVARLWNDSVALLNSFNKYGSSYIISSVIICVFLIAVVYAALLYIILKKM